MVIVERQSPFTGRVNQMEVNMTPEAFEAAYTAWRNGALIQNAFSMLTADQREFIKTGIYGAEWETLLGPEE